MQGQTAQIVVVVGVHINSFSYDQSERFDTAPAKSPKPPWLSCDVIKTRRERTGVREKENENDCTESVR